MEPQRYKDVVLHVPDRWDDSGFTKCVFASCSREAFIKAVERVSGFTLVPREESNCNPKKPREFLPEDVKLFDEAEFVVVRFDHARNIHKRVGVLIERIVSKSPLHIWLSIPLMVFVFTCLFYLADRKYRRLAFSSTH